MQEPGAGQPQRPVQPVEQQPMQTPPSSLTPSAPIPAPTEYVPTATMGGGTLAANTSGLGAQSVLPDELKGFNWGACLMTWIWSIGHQFWLGLLAIPLSIVLGMIPIIGFFLQFGLMAVFGVKGNEWAWQHRRWESTEQFRTVQNIWMKWGIGLLILSIVLFGVLFATVGVAMFTAASNNPQAFQTRP